jgi:hypothetical protein
MYNTEINFKTLLMKKSVFILLPIFAFILLACGGGNEDTTTKTQSETTDTVIKEDTPQEEPKTEEFAKQRVSEYWENNVFDDFGANYELLCNNIKDLVNKETFIEKYREDRQESPLAKPEKVDVGNIRIEDDTAIARVTIYTLVYEEGTSSTTEINYENGRWCRQLKDDTIEWLLE